MVSISSESILENFRYLDENSETKSSDENISGRNDEEPFISAILFLK
jgi:hypothetical protein